MAERHPHEVMNLVDEYQWNRKSYSSHKHRERERERGIFLLHKCIQLHIFCAAVLKPCKKNQNLQVYHTFFCFLSTLTVR